MPTRNYGRRGGTSVNAGKSVTVYEATLPDGRVVQKRSFAVSTEMAFLGAYQARAFGRPAQADDPWEYTAIRETAEEIAAWGQMPVAARRVDR